MPWWCQIGQNIDIRNPSIKWMRKNVKKRLNLLRYSICHLINCLPISLLTKSVILMLNSSHFQILAPLYISILQTSWFLLLAAIHKGVFKLVSLLSTNAPFRINILQISPCPFLAAHQRGVFFFISSLLTSAPFSINILHTLRSPISAALCNNVRLWQPYVKLLTTSLHLARSLSTSGISLIIMDGRTRKKQFNDSLK